MKLSVISDASGKVLAASFTPASATLTVGGPVDSVAVPKGCRVHHVSLAPELAGEMLSGDFAKALSNYTLEVKGKKAALIRKVSKK